MATLANQKPSNTFDSLLHIEDDTAGLVASSVDSRVVQDGVGANSALALATDSVRITSTNKLYFNDVGGEYISGNAAILSIVGGDEIDLTATAIDINGTVDISGVATFGTHVVLGDSDELKLGAGTDLEIYSDGTHGIIKQKSGGILKLATEVSGVAVTIGHGTSEVTVADNLTVTGDLTISSPGVFKGYMPWITQGSFTDSSGDAVFIPLGSSIIEDDTPDANQVQQRLCMPYVGYLEKIIFRCQDTADTCDFEIYKAPSGTDADEADANKLGGTQQIEDDAAHTLKTVTFGTSYSFAAGDVMAIKLTSESAPGEVDITVVWRVLVD